MDGKVKRTYIPPDAKTIKAYVGVVCADLTDRYGAQQAQEMKTELAAFLTFMAERMAKYLNEGHEAFLLKGYPKKQEMRS